MSFASLNPLSVSDFLPDTAKVQDLGNKFHNTRQIAARSKPEYIVTTVTQLNSIIDNLLELINFAEANAPASPVSFTSFAIRAVESIVGIAASDTKNTIGKVIDELISNYHITYGKVIDEVDRELSNILTLMDETVDYLLVLQGQVIDNTDMTELKEIALKYTVNHMAENASAAIDSVVLSLMTFINKSEDDDKRMRYHRQHLNFMPLRIFIDPSHSMKCKDARIDLNTLGKQFSADVNMLNTSTLTWNKMKTFAKQYYNVTLNAGKVASCLKGYYNLLLEIKDWLKQDDFVNQRTKLITSDLRTSYSVEELSKDLRSQIGVFKNWASLYAKSELTQSQMAEEVDGFLQAKVMFCWDR